MNLELAQLYYGSREPKVAVFRPPLREATAEETALLESEVDETPFKKGDKVIVKTELPVHSVGLEENSIQVSKRDGVLTVREVIGKGDYQITLEEKGRSHSFLAGFFKRA